MMPLEGFRCISTLYLNREAREEETDGDRSHRLRVGPRKLGQRRAWPSRWWWDPTNRRRWR